MSAPLDTVLENHRLKQLLNNGAVVLAIRTAKSFGDHDCPHIAAGLAYYSFFSVFPLTLALIAMFSLIADPETVQRGIVRAIGAYLPGSADFVAENIRTVLENRGSAGIIAIASLLWSASAFFEALQKSINRAWDVKKDRSFMGQKVVEFATLLAAAALLFISLSFTFISLRVQELISVYLGTGASFFDPMILSRPLTVLNLVLNLLPIPIAFFIFLALYRFIPNTTVRVTDVWMGALVAAMLFETAKWGFVWYLSNLASYNLVYGSLASVIVLLFWAYISAVILLLGAEMASAYSKLFGSQKPHDSGQ
ncbi:MAG: YihY/virulence factor BrkB family protein [Dehalococcoidia bacterium]|nr:YihY/virulence factor BrkB family protein [Dehalococcoidia bacterium]